MMETFLTHNCALGTVDLVRYYHSIRPKLKYKEIVTIINKHHGQHLTFRTFKRICEKESLNRRRNVSELLLCQVISNELCSSVSLVGYRQMTECISLKYGINVSKESVRKALIKVIYYLFICSLFKIGFLQSHIYKYIK